MSNSGSAKEAGMLWHGGPRGLTIRQLSSFQALCVLLAALSLSLSLTLSFYSRAHCAPLGTAHLSKRRTSYILCAACFCLWSAKRSERVHLKAPVSLIDKWLHPPSPPIKESLTSPPSPREKESRRLKQRPKVMVVLRLCSLRKERVFYKRTI
jgi:hypothetical protein